MARTKSVNKEQLQKDIEAIKYAKTAKEVDDIVAKYSAALAEMEKAKAAKKAEEEEKKAPAKKAPAKKAPAKKAAAKKEEPKEEKKAPAKKATTAKKAPAKKATAAAAATAAAKKEPAKKTGGRYNGKFEVFQVGDGFQYNLKASNGEILVASELYTTKDGCMKAIDAVRRNVETGGEIRVFADKRGRHKFKLIAGNHRVIAISANYMSEKNATSASESFKKFALTADVVEVELEDKDAATATPVEIGKVEHKDGGKFEYEKYNDEFSWDLKASNGQILCQADGYTSKASCLNSIEVFKSNVKDGTFKIVKDKNDHYLFKLYTQNGRVCAIGESYETKQGAESAAISVTSFYQKADLVELKEE